MQVDSRDRDCARIVPRYISAIVIARGSPCAVCNALQIGYSALARTLIYFPFERKHCAAVKHMGPSNGRARARAYAWRGQMLNVRQSRRGVVQNAAFPAATCRASKLIFRRADKRAAGITSTDKLRAEGATCNLQVVRRLSDGTCRRHVQR